ncbi:MAG: hypothetical protein ABIQ39_08690, partial [Ilumatobacteraceae bacterium]
KGKAHVAMIYASIVMTIVGSAWLFFDPRFQGLAVFAMIPLIAQFQMLGHHRRPNRRPAHLGSATLFAVAEAAAWQSGDLQRFVDGQLPSPWYRAHQQLTQGHPDIARQVIVSDFTDPEEPNWWPPDAAPVEALDTLVRILPLPLPTGRIYSEFVLAGVLLRLDQFEDAAHYAADAYQRQPSPMLAICVSRAAAGLHDRPIALGWLRTAVGGAPPTDGLRHAADHAPEYAALRADPEFRSILQVPA